MKRIFSASAIGLVALIIVSGCEADMHGTKNSNQDENDYAVVATASECPRKFSPIDVLEFLRGSEDSEAALAAQWDGDVVTGYSIYRFRSVKYLVDAGLRDGDILVSVCNIPVGEVFGGDHEAWPEQSFCCTSDIDKPSLIFERWGQDEKIHVAFPAASE